MARVYQGERVALARVSGRSSGSPTGCSRDEPDGAGLEGLRAHDARLLGAVLVAALRDPAHPGHPSLQPRGFDSGPGTSPSTPTSSFVTNTNWQYYGGETTMSYFSQMAGLAVQNFVSAAVGMAVMRGGDPRLRAPRHRALGNFWVDLTRTLLYILLPLSFVGALLLVSQGVDPDARPARSPSRPSAATRRWRSARRPRRSRSSSSAPTAAASSTSTPRCRSRTRRSSRTSSRCCSSC